MYFNLTHPTPTLDPCIQSTSFVTDLPHPLSVALLHVPFVVLPFLCFVDPSFNGGFSILLELSFPQEDSPYSNF